jgi:hypothetical protein
VGKSTLLLDAPVLQNHGINDFAALHATGCEDLEFSGPVRQVHAVLGDHESAAADANGTMAKRRRVTEKGLLAGAGY